MKRLVFPDTWGQLELAPGVRSELICCIRDVRRWNDELSRIRVGGATDLIGFLFDSYRLEEGVEPWIGQFIFADEVEPLRQFINAFWRFAQECQAEDKYLEQLHKKQLPADVVALATALQAALARRGVPEYVEDGQG